MSFAVRGRFRGADGTRSDIVSQEDEPGSAPPPRAEGGSGTRGRERTSSGGKAHAYHGSHDAAAGGALTRGSGVTRPNGTATRPGGHVRRDLVTLLADLSRTAPPASSRFRRSPCLRRRPWTPPGRWCTRGRPFAAHEVLEARWKAGPSEERDLWQGLAQICVGLTHAARGNSVGAGRLVERGVARLEEYDAGTGPTYGLDLSAVVACARERVAPSP